MSLTELLNGRAMRERFRKTFPVPKIRLDALMLAQPQTDRHALVCTAFDYLLRFHLQRTFPKAVHGEWAARHAVNLVRKLGEVPGEWADAVLPVADLLYRAEKEHQKFIKTGDITRTFVRSVLLMAPLDMIYRTGRLVSLEQDRRTTALDIKDLQSLIEIAQNSGHFQPDRAVVLNPTFSKCPKDVGKADADLIIDGTLIDIKTTRHLRLTQAMYSQLLGYHALSKLDGRFGIDRAGIYFARYGILKVFSLDGIDTDTILGWFGQ